MKVSLKKLIIGIAIVIFFVAVLLSGATLDRLYGFAPLDKFFPTANTILQQKVVNEDSDVIDVVKNVGPSVVTVSAQTPPQQVIQFSPFGGFTQGTQGGSV